MLGTYANAVKIGKTLFGKMSVSQTKINLGRKRDVLSFLILFPYREQLGCINYNIG